jgi:hypothetical protein
LKRFARRISHFSGVPIFCAAVRAQDASAMAVRPPTIALFAAAVIALCGAGGASAAVRSSNWSGYAVYHPGVRFREASAVWRQPSASCTPGHRTYSAFWVGIGGYRRGSHALEQVGTEVDCTSSGQLRSSAWFEVVPAATRWMKVPVNPGDTVAASVTVHGHSVTLALADFSSGHGFRHTVRAARVDVSSAEWIVEAPTDCIGNQHCRTLPLANFGLASFSRASARSRSGHTGTISDPSWTATRITLRARSGQFVRATSAAAAATPSGLESGGSAFRVSFSRLAAGAVARAARVVSLFH